MNTTVTGIPIVSLSKDSTILDWLESDYLDLAHLENQLNVLITTTIVNGNNYEEENAPNTVASFMRAYNSVMECIDNTKNSILYHKDRIAKGQSLNDPLFPKY